MSYSGSLLSLASPGFELKGFPSLIGISETSQASEPTSSTTDDELKSKLKKASAQLKRFVG